MTLVSTEDKMPKGPHWAIVTYETRYVEGDERSRTNPGHGYPAYTESYVSYQAFDDEHEWVKEIRRKAEANHRSRPEAFTAMRVIPAEVTTSVQVKVAIDQ